MTVVMEPPPAPPAPDPEVGALIDALLGTSTAIAPLPVEDTGRTDCHTCPHERKQHSRIGCLEEGCTCTVTYMDL